MTTIYTVAVLSALGIVLAGNTVLGQATASKKPTAAQLPAQLAPGQTAKPMETPVRGISEKLSQPNRPTRPDTLDQSRRPDSPDQIKKMLNDIKASQSKFLTEQTELRRKMTDATEAQREQIHAEMQDKRDAFLEQQREMREEFRKRVTELHDQLKNHGDVISSSKEQAKAKLQHRKGGGN